MPKKCWNILVFGQASKSGQRPVVETIEEPERQASSAPKRWRKYLICTPVADPDGIFDEVTVTQTY
jgi:hypothetical protein